MEGEDWNNLSVSGKKYKKGVLSYINSRLSEDLSLFTVNFFLNLLFIFSVSAIKLYIISSLLKSDLMINLSQFFLIIFTNLSFRKPLPLDNNDIPSNILVFPEPFIP